MSTYIDLLITNDDVTLDAGKNPLLVTDKACIVQDLKHMIRERGYLVQMIGQRDSGKVQQLMQAIEAEADNDLRIRPGTATVNRLDTETFVLTATTMDFGLVEVTL
jgi:hypothetical protein